MSRLKQFPETIYVGMDRENEMHLIPSENPVFFITPWQGHSKANTPCQVAFDFTFTLFRQIPSGQNNAATATQDA